jgi:hypothetical protein
MFRQPAASPAIVTVPSNLAAVLNSFRVAVSRSSQFVPSPLLAMYWLIEPYDPRLSPTVVLVLLESIPMNVS